MTTIPEHLKFDRSITVADLVSQFDLLLLTGRSEQLLTHVSSPQAAVAGSFISLYQDKAVADLPAGESFICLTNNIIGASLKRRMHDRGDDWFALWCSRNQRQFDSGAGGRQRKSAIKESDRQ